MAQGTRVYKTQLAISDSDRHCYEQLNLSLALHPSETPERLVARLVAFALEYQEGLEFGKGISNAEDATIWRRSLDERVLHWIEIGQPDAERMTKFYRRSEKLSLFCYAANSERWWQQHKASFSKLSRMEVFVLDWGSLTQLAAGLDKRIEFQLVKNENHLYLSLNDVQVDFELQSLDLDP
ncbi:MAG: YaeQ family protein [Motiliproteus sp.]